MQATRSTITDGAIGFGLLQMVWRATPLAVFASWEAAITEAMPADFDWTEEVTLTTALPTTDSTPGWIAQLPPDVQSYYASVSLPVYTTPIQYYEYYQFVSTIPPQPSQTSVLVGAGATATSIFSSVESSSTPADTISARPASTHQTWSSPTSLSDATGVANENISKGTTVTTGQKVAIAVSVVAMTLAAVCGLIIYLWRIRPARKRRLAETNPAPGQRSTTVDVKALTSSEPDGGHSNVSSWNEKPQATMSSPAALQAPTLSSLPELEAMSAAGMSVHHASYHGSIELAGSFLANAGGEGFTIDAGVHMPPQATSDDR